MAGRAVVRGDELLNELRELRHVCRERRFPSTALSRVIRKRLIMTSPPKPAGDNKKRERDDGVRRETRENWRA